MLQLDIFDDSRDVMLRNDLVDALLRADAAHAGQAQRNLQAEYPDDGCLAAAERLVAALQPEPESEAGPADAHALSTARAEIENLLAPAALQLLGNAAAAWLAPFWARLARRAQGQAYDATAPQIHAAAFWLAAARWAEVAEAVQRIESWRRVPTPLAWMAEARWHLDGPDAAWPLIAELAWLAPPRLPALARALPDAALRRLLQRFEAGFDDDGGATGAPEAAGAAWAWWPAWALIEQPLLAGPMSGAQTGQDTEPERAWQIVQALLRLERRGSHHELMDHRRQLRDLSAGLFQAYMKTR
jgi:hypothetical protein